MIRTLLERYLRQVTFPRRLPAGYGGCQFYASTEGGLRYLRPDITKTDPELLEFAKEYIHSDSVVWDIGANIGLFTFAAAGIAQSGFVLSVEPDLWLCRLIQKSLRIRQARANIELLPMAISGEPGISHLMIANRARAANQLKEAPSAYTQSGGIRESQATPTTTLDWLLDHYRAPQVMKIDIEGMEFRALEAAPRLLTEARPIIYAEDYENSLGGILSGHGYSIQRVGPNILATPSVAIPCPVETLR